MPPSPKRQASLTSFFVPSSPQRQATLTSFFGPPKSASKVKPDDVPPPSSPGPPSASSPTSVLADGAAEPVQRYPSGTTHVRRFVGRKPTGAADLKASARETGVVREYKLEARGGNGQAPSGLYRVEWKAADGKGTGKECWMTEEEVGWGNILYDWLGVSVAKEFLVDGEMQTFNGLVVDVTGADTDDDGTTKEDCFFRVLYDDGDEEDLDYGEVLRHRATWDADKRRAAVRASQSSKRGKRRAGITRGSDRSSPARATTAAEAASPQRKKPRKAKHDDEPAVKEEDEPEAGDEDEEDAPSVGQKHDDGEEKIPMSPSGRPSRRAAMKKISYKEEADNDDVASEDGDEMVVESKRRPVRKADSKGRKPKATDRRASVAKSKQDCDSDFDEPAPMEDDSIDEVDVSDDSMSEDEEEEIAPKSKRAPKKRAATPATKKAKRGNSNLQDELEELIRERRDKFKPNNNPQKMPKHAYVDPVGVDPTSGIVEGIIYEQVRKVGGLLRSVIQRCQDPAGNGEKGFAGERIFPLKLQTACSGTDAPSIALGLIQESLDKLFAEEKEDHGFSYSHVMSCEIEPFKQAYIGRNFPGVTLFPDICKLTGSDLVLDVYGKPEPVPDGNMFVAGTSCKDFSMLKTKHRKDIEDKGTSGETFLAAVEFLETKQPPVAIFENTDGAPWEKMQEYITGRIKLTNRNDKKGITACARPNADVDLSFSVNDSMQYVAEVIPRQVGLRAGSVVVGFVKGGHDAKEVIPMKAKSHDKKVTLGELAKRHKINLEEDTLVVEKRTKYCTHLCKVDTKDYGLPQTRNRKYLFIWRCEDPDDDLGEYFQEILDHLKTPLLYSMDAFLLPDTHDRIRCFREAVRSGPGLMMARDRAKELDFMDYGLSKKRDTPNHIIFREKMGINEGSRWLTGWDTRGRKKLAPSFWSELFDMWDMRRLDMIDCFGAAAVRDTISRDPLHHAFTWDISQNVDRAPFRAADVGVSGCVTPGGELLLTHKGRSAMGFEKLLLQGIPFSRLLLGPETEVQLSDLAGNAMSVPVVNATLLAAICAPQLRRERERMKNVALADSAISHKYDATNGTVLAERGDLYCVAHEGKAKDFLVHLAKHYADDAFQSSALCICESSGRTSYDPKILECQGCGMSMCHGCTTRHRTCSHILKEVQVQGQLGRPDPHHFERKLRCAAPSLLRLGKECGRLIEDEEGLENPKKKRIYSFLEAYSFQLQRVDRKKGQWILTYGAWEDFGAGRQIAEVRLVLGRIMILDNDVGGALYVRCFEPSIRKIGTHRGSLRDCARLFMRAGDDFMPEWEIPSKSTKCELLVRGLDPGPSHRVEVGVNDTAHDVLKGHKVKQSWVPAVESRNTLVKYHPRWKTWPGTIVVSGDKSNRVNGEYKRLKCEHTTVLSALWRREATDDQSTMFIYIRPEVQRTGLDVAVISPSPSYTDKLEVCELNDWIPENALVDRTHKTSASFIEWTSAPDFTLEVPTPPIQMNSADRHAFQESIRMRKPAVLCELIGLQEGTIKSIIQNREVEERSGIVKLDLVGKSGTKNAKRMSIVAAPALLKYAAEGKLPVTLSEWYDISATSGKFGLCDLHVPHRPVEQWQAAEGRKILVERVYDQEESQNYYQSLLNRPTVFEVNVDQAQGRLVVNVNPCVAAHHAAAPLLRGRGGTEALAKSLKLSYCLAELSSMGEPETKEFRVPNSDLYSETHVEGLSLPLYTRQARALTRMQAIEDGSVHFSEAERSEHVLPGIGWCLIARAEKKSPLRGGVLGDAIGSGKTVVTIALILAGVNRARLERNVDDCKSSATLIVVPPGLVRQWDDERKKFTGNSLKCITIDCVDTLKKHTVREICSADIVIVPASILEEEKGKSRPYTEHLSKKAGARPIPPAPRGYSQREAPTIEGTWIRNQAPGPDIYVGNRGKQIDRDVQAYYGHCYSEAISKLRMKGFSPSDKGVPLERYTWERIVIDECHETLVTGRHQESKAEDFKAQSRRGARELLGVSQTDPVKRPLLASKAVWGLTGTPLLETESRVTELANLMGGTYLTGSAQHWRKEERESGRDLFLNQQETFKSREYRCAVQASCHEYVKEACQRNRGAMLDIKVTRNIEKVRMTQEDSESFIQEISTIQLQSFSILPDQLGEKAGDVLSITSKSKARHPILMKTIDSILNDEPDTKIIIFANAIYGGYDSALEALQGAKKKDPTKKFCHLSRSDSVDEQNEIISWFRHIDATEEDRIRPRILLLTFDQAAGHNLQEACHHVILFDPMYSGTDAVADASVEEQAVGRVVRQGQTRDVTVIRIVVTGPQGERCLDDAIVERNLNDDVLRAATSNFD